MRDSTNLNKQIHNALVFSKFDIKVCDLTTVQKNIVNEKN